MIGLLLSAGAQLKAADLAPDMQAKVDEQIQLAQQLAADPVIVNAVKAQNAALPADFSAMTQDKWKSLSVLDPFIKGLSKGAVADCIRVKKSALVSEAFVSDANGLKVDFLAKTSGWSHKGKPKHDQPMAGKHWQGEVEVDASTGLQQLQISVPVLDEGKPIGSLVVGLAISKLK